MRRRATCLLLVLTTWLLGCAAGGEQQIAGDVCALVEDLVHAGDDAVLTAEVIAEVRALEARAAEAGLGDEDVQTAVRDRCPELLARLDAQLAGSEGGAEGAEAEASVGAR